jgi:hypothetical protein
LSATRYAAREGASPAARRAAETRRSRTAAGSRRAAVDHSAARRAAKEKVGTDAQPPIWQPQPCPTSAVTAVRGSGRQTPVRKRLPGA